MIRFKSNEINSIKYYQIPQELFENPRYEKLNNDSRVLYGILLNRMSLSQKNGWFNEKGEVYFIFTRENLMKLLKVSSTTITKAFNQLKSCNLIEEKVRGLGKPNLIYIGHLELETLDESLNQRIFDSRDKEFLIQEPRNFRPNNTYINNTNNKLVSSLPDDIPIPEIPEKETNELTDIFSSLNIDLYENKSLQTIIKTSIVKAYNDVNVRELLKHATTDHIDDSITRYKEAEKLRPEGIKNPKLYYYKCLISALEEYGLKANNSNDIDLSDNMFDPTYG